MAIWLLGLNTYPKSKRGDFILLGVLDIKVKRFTKNIKVHHLGIMNTHSKYFENSVVHFCNTLLWTDSIINTTMPSFYLTNYEVLRKPAQHSAKSITLTHIAQPLRWTPLGSLWRMECTVAYITQRFLLCAAILWFNWVQCFWTIVLCGVCSDFLKAHTFPRGLNSVTALVFGNIINPEWGS